MLLNSEWQNWFSCHFFSPQLKWIYYIKFKSQSILLLLIGQRPCWCHRSKREKTGNLTIRLLRNTHFFLFVSSFSMFWVFTAHTKKKNNWYAKEKRNFELFGLVLCYVLRIAWYISHPTQHSVRLRQFLMLCLDKSSK